MRMTEDFKQRKIEELQTRIYMLEHIIACCYQFVGAHGAPDEWFDVLSLAANGETPFHEDIENLLPYTPKP
jgi:hypothetical protein